MQKWIDRIYFLVTLLVVAALPLITFPLASSVYEIPKLVFLVACVGILLLLKALEALVTGRFEYHYSRLDMPLIALAFVYIITTLLKTPNKMEAILLPGNATAIVAAVVFYLLINQITKKKTLLYGMFVGAGLYSLVAILAKTGILSALTFLPMYFRAEGFNPGGGYLPSALFLLMVLPISAVSIIWSKDFKLQILSVIVSILTLFGLGLSIYQLTPGKATMLRLPSYYVSWAVTTESLTNSPVFGMGPGNYLTAFNRYRPLNYNMSDIWNLKYLTATNFVFTAITETGIVGLSALILLSLFIWRVIKDRLRSGRSEGQYVPMAAAISAIIMSVALLLVPFTHFLLVMYLILLALAAKTRVFHLNLSLKDLKDPSVTNKVPAIVAGVPLLLLVLYVYFWTVKYMRAEVVYAGALTSVVQNKAQDAFTRMNKAVELNPRVDRYRISNSQLSFVLANAIATQATKETATQISDQDREQITKLIQLSIQEVKAAVALNPLRAGNWEVLARTYRSIMPLAKGADQFAVQSYTQAILLDPHNPNLRLALGEILYSAKQYEQAQRVLELAVSTKPDHANARYNLAFVYSIQNKLDAAIEEMKRVVSLVKPGSQDATVAQEALKQLEEKKKLAADKEKSGEELTAPESEVPQVIKPPVELPQDAQPPETPVEEEKIQNASQSPSPRAIPSGSPVPSAS